MYSSNTTEQPVNILSANNTVVNITDQKNISLPAFLNQTIYLTKNKSGRNDSELANSKLPGISEEDDDDEQYLNADTEEDYNKLAAKHNISQVKTVSVFTCVTYFISKEYSV